MSLPFSTLVIVLASFIGGIIAFFSINECKKYIGIIVQMCFLFAVIFSAAILIGGYLSISTTIIGLVIGVLLGIILHRILLRWLQDFDMITIFAFSGFVIGDLINNSFGAVIAIILSFYNMFNGSRIVTELQKREAFKEIGRIQLFGLILAIASFFVFRDLIVDLQSFALSAIAGLLIFIIFKMKIS